MTEQECGQVNGKRDECTDGDASPTKVAREEVPTYYLAVDIERVGAGFHYGILAVGACFGKSNGTIIEQPAFCSKVPPQEGFDPVCWSTFWHKFPKTLERIDKEAIPNHIEALHTWLLNLETKYGPFGRKHKDKVVLRLLSDNPAFDIGMINLEFNKAGLPRPMAEMWDDYVPTDDPTEQVRGLTEEQMVVVNSFITCENNHWPVDDATRIFQMRCGITAVLGD